MDEKIFQVGCRATGAFDFLLTASSASDAAVRAKEALALCDTLRSDGAVVEVSGDYNAVAMDHHHARGAKADDMGVFGLSYYQIYGYRLHAATINGVVPYTGTVADGTYPLARPLYLYIKKAHLGQTLGLQEFVDFFLSDEMIGPKGRLVSYSMVPDPALRQTRADVVSGKVIETLP